MVLSRSIGARFDGVLGTTALDARRWLASLLAPAPGVAARPGVMPGGVAVLVAGTPGWAYTVAAGVFVTSRGAVDGAQVFTNDGPVQVPCPVAPGTSGASRIDVVWVAHPSDGENGDDSSTPLFGVASGLASLSAPVAPAIPAGALELARNTMMSAATSTASAGNAIAQTWRYTALRGAPILVRNIVERDELTAFASATNPIYVHRLNGPYQNKLEVCLDGATWWPIPAVPIRHATGKATTGAIVAAGIQDLDVVFPAGLFAVPPHVKVAVGEPAGRYMAGWLPVSLTASGMTVRVSNRSSGTGAAGEVHWEATQQTPTSAFS